MKRIVVVTLIIIFLGGILAFTIAYNMNMSDGFRSGTIVNLSHKGVVFKTYEGQLLSGGLATSEGGDIASNIWDFSIEKADKQVRIDIEKAVDERYPVKVRYKEKYYTFFWRGDSKYFVYSVEKVGQKK